MNKLHSSLVPYSVPQIAPHPDRLYVVSVIFNPRRFLSRYRLYRAFEKQVQDAGAQLLTVEIAFGDRPFEVTEASEPWHVQLRTNVELWHEERAINIGIERLKQIVPAFKRVAWIDADITFSRPDWAHETVQMLEHHPVIQLFGMAANLDPDGHIQWNCSSAFREFFWTGQKVENGCFYDDLKTGGHPGLAWAATREALEHLGGLMDFCISGSGDLHMANALKGQPMQGDQHNDTVQGFSPGFLDRMNDWAKAAAAFRANVGFVPGTVLHHWHGKPAQRGYPQRWDILKAYQFDPATDIKEDAQGLWQFVGNKPKMEAAIKRTLILRNEDSVDP